MKPDQHLKIMVNAVMKEIKQKLHDFCNDRSQESLTPASAAEVAQGLQEATLSAAREGYQAFLESYDIADQSIQIHGITYRRKLKSSKAIMSPFGLIEITRNLYQPDRGGKTHVPLDAMWGMEGEYATPEVREASLYTLSHVTASETAALLKKCAPFHPSATAIQAMADRNAMVGSFSFYGEVPLEGRSPERLQSFYVSHMPEEKGITFKKKFEEEVKDIESKIKDEVIRVILCDGHRSLWKYIDSSPLYAGYEKLVDFFHTSEHLSKAAEAIFGKGSAEGQGWYKTWYEKLKTEEGAAWALLRSIDYHRDTRRLSKIRREALRKERTFFKRNKKRMKYAEFRARGLPIGSGPVEAACKTIVKTRMGRSGMRWSREGGQHILHLRTYNKSGRWNSFWMNCNRLRRVA